MHGIISYKAKKHLTSGIMHDLGHKKIYDSIIHMYVQLSVWCVESCTPKQSKNYQH